MQSLFAQGQYYKAARYAFDAIEGGTSRADSYSWITLSLMRAGLYQGASYFFIRTLQSGDKSAIRRVLTQTETLLVHVGGDLLRPYLIRHTAYEDYDVINRSSYLYALGKSALLEGQEERAIGYLNGVSPRSPIWPFALQLRGSALAILERAPEAIRDFRACADKADDYATAAGDAEAGSYRAQLLERQRREAEDLKSRCIAGEARTQYQIDKFEDADRTYDRIPKQSLVWPDILFEQAWNAFGRQEYNRTLGKLVSYKSPALQFVFNSEVDVLRAQAYLALCLYNDADDVIREFHQKYQKTGQEVKRLVETNGDNLGFYYGLGRDALKGPLSTRNDLHRLANRFVRGPYFQNLVLAERAVVREQEASKRFDQMQAGVSHQAGQGFPGFLDLVLQWRLRTVRLLGGAFVKNSLMDYHSILVADAEKIDFIKLEMLSRAKEKLIYKRVAGGERSRGNIEPSRRDDQYRWTFNGEFWNDELGDYVFGLESECGAGHG